MQNKPVDQLLFGFLEYGKISRQRTEHDEARSGPRRVAVGRMSIVCSQRLPQTCWLQFGACDESRSIFPHSDFQKFDRYVRDLLHFDVVVFASVLRAPNKVLSEVSVSCKNDDVVFEPFVQVDCEYTQGVWFQAPSLDQESEGCIGQLT